MAKIIGTGIAQDNSYIFLKLPRTSKFDTYKEKFYIKEKHQINLEDGCDIRKPHFEVTIFGVRYACFWESATIENINLCYVLEGEQNEKNNKND